MKSTKIITNDNKFFSEEKLKLNPVIYPIITSSTYKVNDINKLDKEKYTYSRSDNPTRNILEHNLALLEKAYYGLSFSSGLGAITCINHLKIANNGVLASIDLYGGTKRFFDKVSNHFISYIDFNKISDDILEEIISGMTVNIIWIETPSNPLLQVIDIKRLSKLTKKYNKILIVDNTFLSPIFQNPLTLGADLVVHSVTKYINGMSDVIMGAIMTNNKILYNELKFLQNAMGVIPSPYDCYLVNRSIKTLELRMIRHGENALIIANRLCKHNLIEKVIYPGLNNSQNKIVSEQMLGGGGMISFYLKFNLEQTKKFLNNLKMIPIAESLGGIETLIEHPALMTHAGISKENREKIGITDNLIRLSVGLENEFDIYTDIIQALNNINKSKL